MQGKTPYGINLNILNRKGAHEVGGSMARNHQSVKDIEKKRDNPEGKRQVSVGKGSSSHEKGKSGKTSSASLTYGQEDSRWTCS